MKKIMLTQGQHALVDDEDYNFLNQWKWQAHRRDIKYTFYAVRTCYDEGKKTLRMHNIIAEIYIIDVVELDHIDRNGLNNCKDNLRICTKGENRHNRRNWGKYPKGVSKNVSKYKNKQGEVKEYIQYQAMISINSKAIYLGSYNTPKDAEKAYKKAAKKHYPNYN